MNTVSPYPTTFAIETVLGCNLRCVECAVGANIVKRPYGHMKLQQFMQIAERIKPYCRYVYLHIWGEPMLNPDIIPIIKVASTFTGTNISTNANTLDERLAKDLIYSGVSSIIVSLDAMSQEIYSRYRRRGQIEKAQLGLVYLTKHLLRSGRPVKISPQFIVFDHNKHEMQAFEKFCHELGLQPVFKSPYLREGSCLKNANIPQYERHIGKDIMERRQNMARDCDIHNSCTILLDGSVVICCYDHNGQTTFGNIYTQSFEEIWENPAYVQHREQLQLEHAPQFCIDHCLAY